MLAYYLTFHQILPEFLDLIFSFGIQLLPRDSHYGALLHRNRLSDASTLHRIEELGRSGRELQVAYNLKAIEPDNNNRHWPWAMRQAAVQNTLDLERGRSNWMIVKANNLLQDRIKSEMGDLAKTGQASFVDLQNALDATLKVHVIVSDWAGDQWRWYINFIEERIQDSTRSAMSIPVAALKPSRRLNTHIHDFRPQDTRQDSKPSRSSTLKTLVNRFQSSGILRRLTFHPSSVAEKDIITRTEPAYFAEPEQISDQEDVDAFSFQDLRDLYFLEDRVNEAKVVLHANSEVLKSLKSYYRDASSQTDCPESLRSLVDLVLPPFESRIGAIMKECRIHENGIDALARMISERKTLLHSILEYRNVEMNKMMGTEAQISNARMTAMTEDMHMIAKKTEEETVSMRIITLVTLFFLPGTFISTLMSTDIIRFGGPNGTDPSQGTFSISALRLFFAISIPLMVATFAAWIAVYRWVKQRDRKKNSRRHSMTYPSIA